MRSKLVRVATDGRLHLHRALLWAALLVLAVVLSGTVQEGRAAGQQDRVLAGHTGAVFSVAFSPGGTVLASASEDGTIRIWDVATGSVRRVLKGAGQWASATVFTPDGAALVGTSFSRSDSAIKRYIQLWDTRTWSLTRTLREGGGFPAVSPDGRLLASTTEGTGLGLIKLWELRSGRVIRTLVGHALGPVYSVAFSPDGLLLASGGSDSTLRIWDVPAGTQRRIITRNEFGRQIGLVRSVAWSPDGRTIASASGTIDDPTITLWDIATGTVTRHLREGVHGNGFWLIQVVAFSPDGQLVAGGDSRYGAVGVWSVQTGEWIHPYGHTGMTGMIMALAFSPDGKILASASTDKTIWLSRIRP